MKVVPAALGLRFKVSPQLYLPGTDGKGAGMQPWKLT